MRKLLLAAAGAMALVGGATTANAASTITAITSPLTPPASSLFGASYNNMVGATTAINDTFNFTLIGSAAADAQVSTILLGNTANINFSSVTLDGNAFTRTSADGGPETWALLSPVLLANGTHAINVLGTLTGPNGSYSGTLNVAAVPEPATWMMMLLGFGAIGMVVRRRRQPALAQIA
jgi:hypothetical protein